MKIREQPPDQRSPDQMQRRVRGGGGQPGPDTNTQYSIIFTSTHQYCPNPPQWPSGAPVAEREKWLGRLGIWPPGKGGSKGPGWPIPPSTRTGCPGQPARWWLRATLILIRRQENWLAMQLKGLGCPTQGHPDPNLLCTCLLRKWQRESWRPQPLSRDERQSCQEMVWWT